MSETEKNITIGKRLRDLRKLNNYTQNDIAKKLNIVRTAYAMYESEKNTPPLEALIILADLYKCSLDYLTARHN